MGESPTPTKAHYGASTSTQGSSRRDPTPKSSEKQRLEAQRREPPAATGILHGTPQRRQQHQQYQNSHMTSSDPPIDRSRKPLFSPAAGLQSRPAVRGSQSEPRSRPVERGAFLLSPSTTSIPRSMRSLQQQQGARIAQDVELNPRRLSQEFSASHQHMSSAALTEGGGAAAAPTAAGLRRNQAPTPNNNRTALNEDSLRRKQNLMTAMTGTLRQDNQVPTPNNNRITVTTAATTTKQPSSASTIAASLWGSGTGSIWGSDWSELLPRNSVTAPDQEVSAAPASSPKTWNLSRLFSPSLSRSPVVQKEEQHVQPQHQTTQNQKSKVEDETTSIATADTPTSSSSDIHVGVYPLRRLNSDDDNSSSDASSTESQSAYLINKYTRSVPNQPRRRNGAGGGNKKGQNAVNTSNFHNNMTEIYRTPPSPASTLDGLLGPVSQGSGSSTPQPPSKRIHHRLPFSDSKILKSTHVGVVGVRRRESSNAKSSSYLHLEEGGDGVLPRGNNGTEPTLVTNLPKHIQVQIGDDAGYREGTGSSKDEESSAGSDVVLMTPGDGYRTNHTMKSPRSRRVGSALGGVFKRISRSGGSPKNTKKVPYQDLYGEDNSIGDSLSDRLPMESADPGLDLIIKQSTSDTTDDSSPHLNITNQQSSWDQLNEQNGYDDVSVGVGKPDNDGDRLMRKGQKTKRRRKNKAWIVWILICTIVICLAVGLPVYFTMTRDQTEQSESGTTVTPSAPKQQMSDCVGHDAASVGSFSERYSAIRNHLLLKSVGNNPMIDVPDTPQRKALCWISEFDDYNVTVSTMYEKAVIQRYSLAVLYFSTQTESTVTTSSSLAGSDFLSLEHECKWDAVMCTEEGSVSALLLSDKQLTGSLPVEVGNLVDMCKCAQGTIAVRDLMTQYKLDMFSRPVLFYPNLFLISQHSSSSA
jgi:hypothetical protein